VLPTPMGIVIVVQAGVFTVAVTCARYNMGTLFDTNVGSQGNGAYCLSLTFR